VIGAVDLVKNPVPASGTRKTTGTDPGFLRKPRGQSLFFAQFKWFKDFFNNSVSAAFFLF